MSNNDPVIMDNFIDGLQGLYYPSSYLRSVYTAYTKEDYEKLQRQFETGEPALTKEDFENCKL